MPGVYTPLHKFGTTSTGGGGGVTPGTSGIDDLLEHYIALSIEQKLRAGSLISGMHIQTYGAVGPVAPTVEEWLALHILQIKRAPSRRTTWWGRVLFQVSCHSRLATGRVDRQKDAHVVLAAKVGRTLEQSRLIVKKYGGDGSTIAHMSISAPDIVALPTKVEERTETAVVTFDGYVIIGL